MSLPEPLSWGRSLGGAAVAALVALAVYAIGAQEVFYKTDGPFLVLNLTEGLCEHPYNVLYMPLLCGLGEVLRPLGFTAYQVGLALSAAGSALGVGITHVALGRSGLAAGRLWAATALVALAPAVAFFATVVEHHGPFLPFAALSVLCTVELARRPSWQLAVGLGVSMHVAYLVHGTGNLLPGLLLPLFLAWRWDASTRARDLAVAALAGAVHLGLFFGLREIELPGGGVDAALQSVLEEGIGQPRGLRYVPAILWGEWLWPFLPLGVTWLWGFGRRGLRLEAAALAVGLMPYLAICVLLIVGEPEFGAYLLPLAIPAARLTVLALPGRALLPAVVVSAVFAAVAVTRTEEVEAQRVWAAEAVEAGGGSEFVLLVGGPTDIGRAVAALPDVERFVPSVAVAATADGGPAEVARLCAVFDAYVAAQVGAGKVLLLTAGAEDDVRALPAGPALLEHVQAVHGPERVDGAVLRAWRITR